MQRPQQPGSGMSGYHPPVQPNIPTAAVQSLIPRLATTINDIDSFKTLIAAGNADGTLPNWDTLLQRYNVLLSRINALSSYLAQPPPAPPSTPQNPRTTRPTYPALKTAIVHPLRALPTEHVSDSQLGGDGLNPLASQIYFQVVNTMPADPSMIPPVPIPSRGVAAVENDEDHEAGSSVRPKTRALEELRKLDTKQLDVALRTIRERLGRETQASRGLEEEMRRVEQEGDINWSMRIEEEEVDEDEVKLEEYEEDDLFGGDADGDAPMTGSTAAPPRPKAALEGPRSKWSLADYVRHMDTGSMPVAPQIAEPEQPS